jgi:cytochrome c553
MLLHVVVFLAVLLPGFAGPPAPPRLLSATGLGQPGVQSYAPQYPLWSDGAAKARWVFLPPGQKIDTRDGDAWQFPVGTKFWKEFAFSGRKVETRLLWRATDKEWVYATYAWNPEQTEAGLAPAAGLRNHAPIAPGKAHSLPSVNDCKACHEKGRMEVLGFSALQLSTDRDPLAPHAEPLAAGMATLATLVQADRFSPARPEWLAQPPRIRAASPRERAVLGYVSANCGSCHKPEGPLAASGLFLKHTLAGVEEPGKATTLGRSSPYSVPTAKPGESRRVQAGAPERSAMLYRMGVRGGTGQMPPLASVLVDQEAVALVRAWIVEDLARRQ